MKSYYLLSLFILSFVSCSLFNKFGEGPLSEEEQKILKGEQEGKNEKDFVNILLNSLNINVTKKVLNNGLTILVVENHHLPIFSYYTFFKIGSRYESPGFSGATHFLEHMMFKGAKKYGPEEFSRVIESNGGNSNAYTTYDSTVYYESLPIAALDKVVDLEIDRLQNLLLEPQAFESEKNVVLEERKMRYENSPRGKLYIEMMKVMNRGTPYEESVIGQINDIKGFQRDQVLHYFSDYYAPNNAIIVISGDVNSADAIDLIKKKYEKIPYSPKVAKLKEEKDNPHLFSHKNILKNKTIYMRGMSKNPMFYIAYEGAATGTRMANHLTLLSQILSGGESSYFNQKYVNGRRPLVTQMSASNYELMYDGIFTISGELVKGVGIKQFQNIFLRNREKMCKNAITKRTVGRAKNQFLISYFQGLKTNSGVAHFLGLNELYHGDYNFYKNEIREITSITFEEMQETCRNLFMKQKPNYFVLWEKNPTYKVL